MKTERKIKFNRCNNGCRCARGNAIVNERRLSAYDSSGNQRIIAKYWRSTQHHSQRVDKRQRQRQWIWMCRQKNWQDRSATILAHMRRILNSPTIKKSEWINWHCSSKSIFFMLSKFTSAQVEHVEMEQMSRHVEVNCRQATDSVEALSICSKPTPFEVLSTSSRAHTQS